MIPIVWVWPARWIWTAMERDTSRVYDVITTRLTMTYPACRSACRSQHRRSVETNEQTTACLSAQRDYARRCVIVMTKRRSKKGSHRDIVIVKVKSKGSEVPTVLFTILVFHFYMHQNVLTNVSFSKEIFRYDIPNPFSRVGSGSLPD